MKLISAIALFVMFLLAGPLVAQEKIEGKPKPKPVPPVVAPVDPVVAPADACATACATAGRVRERHVFRGRCGATRERHRIIIRGRRACSSSCG
jgi:hypothetical protein